MLHCARPKYTTVRGACALQVILRPDGLVLRCAYAREAALKRQEPGGVTLGLHLSSRRERLGASGAANCVWDLLDLTSTFAAPGDVATVGLSVEVPPAASWPSGVQEVCEVELIGAWANDSSVQVSRTVGFVVDERVDTTFAAPMSVDVDVETVLPPKEDEGRAFFSFELFYDNINGMTEAQQELNEVQVEAERTLTNM